MASVAARTPLALSPGGPHETVKTSTKHKINLGAGVSPNAIPLFGLFTVDVPGDAKLIGDAPKAEGPKGFLQRYTDGSVFSKCVKKMFRSFEFLQTQHYAEALRALICSWQSVATRESRVAHDQRFMEDLFAPMLWRVLCHWRITPGELERDLTIQTLFIKLECVFALAVKRKEN